MSDFSIDIDLNAPATGRRNNEPGFYIYDPAGETFVRPDFARHTWGEVGWQGGGIPAGLSELSSAVVLDKIGTVICRPYWRFDGIAMEQWRFFGSQHWESLPAGARCGNTLRYHMYDADQSNATGAISNFVLPADPAFAVLLDRYGLPPDWDWQSVEPLTVIEFGQFVLEIPWWRRARLRYAGDPGPIDEFDLRLSGRGEAGPQHGIISIMAARGKLLFSHDFGDHWHVFSAGDRPEDWITVEPRFLRVWHRGSRWAFGLIPIDFPGNGSYASPRRDKGYSASAGPPVAGGRDGADGDPFDGRYLPGITAIGISYPDGMADDECTYHVTLVPSREPAAGTYFGRTPELYAVRLMNLPVAEQFADGTADSIDLADLRALDIDCAAGLDVDMATLILDNSGEREIRPGVIGYDRLREYGPIDLDLAGPGEGAPVDVFDGYLLRVRPMLGEGGRRVEAVCASPWIRFKDVKCTEADPCFAGWPTEEVIAWYADRCGVLYEPDPDHDARLPDGVPGRHAWQPEPGREVGEFLRAVAAHDGYELYFEGMTLRYRPLDAEPTVEFYLVPAEGEETPGGKPVLKAIRPIAESPRDPDRHHNVVRVLGQEAGSGDYLVASQRDADNIEDEVGWEKMRVEINRGYDTQARVQFVARTAFDQDSRFPPRLIAAAIVGRAAVRPRQAFEFYGPGLMAHGGVYRIESVRHRVRPGSFTTELVGRWTGAA